MSHSVRTSPLRAGAAIALAFLAPHPGAAAPLFTTLYSFKSGNDAAHPDSALTRDKHGNLYGTSLNGGGGNDLGAIFKLAPNGTETVPHGFAGGIEGARPQGGLLLDKQGNLYGGTQALGANGLGTIYKLSPAGTITVLHNFTGKKHGGNAANGDLIADSAGTLYGTAGGGIAGLGMVFKLTRARHFTVLHEFLGGTDGANAFNGFVTDSAGTLYSATISGGDPNSCGGNCGTLFSLSPDGSNYTVLHRFTGFPNDGANPSDAPAFAPDGALVGFTESGGSTGLGVVYRIAGGAEAVLHNFTATSTDGNSPAGRAVFDSAGNIYGVTSTGGAHSFGTLFKVTPTGGFSILHDFTGGAADGGVPVPGLLAGPNGVFYGTTLQGGTNGFGTVFKFKP